MDNKKARYDLLVVAGLSGAGKSVFVSQLASRQLPAHIMAELPPGAENWRQLKRSPYDFYAESGEIIPGLIFECTIGSPHFARKFVVVANDEQSVHLFDWASSITIVHLKPTAERLLDQISHRRRAHRLKYASADGSTLLGAFAAAVEGRLDIAKKHLAWLFAFYFGYTRRKLEALENRTAWKRRKYQRRGFVESAYERWEDYVRRASAHKGPIKEIFVRPARDAIPGEDIRWERARPSVSRDV